jgi:Na+-translocating ferredoxin:NAD+ oxidoreductase RnfG subunit
MKQGTAKAAVLFALFAKISKHASAAITRLTKLKMENASLALITATCVMKVAVRLVGICIL